MEAGAAEDTAAPEQSAAYRNACEHPQARQADFAADDAGILYLLEAIRNARKIKAFAGEINSSRITPTAPPM